MVHKEIVLYKRIFGHQDMINLGYIDHNDKKGTAVLDFFGISLLTCDSYNDITKRLINVVLKWEE